MKENNNYDVKRVNSKKEEKKEKINKESGRIIYNNEKYKKKKNKLNETEIKLQFLRRKGSDIAWGKRDCLTTNKFKIGEEIDMTEIIVSQIEKSNGVVFKGRKIERKKEYRRFEILKEENELKEKYGKIVSHDGMINIVNLVCNDKIGSELEKKFGYIKLEEENLNDSIEALNCMNGDPNRVIITWSNTEKVRIKSCLPGIGTIVTNQKELNSVKSGDILVASKKEEPLLYASAISSYFNNVEICSLVVSGNMKRKNIREDVLKLAKKEEVFKAYLSGDVGVKTEEDLITLMKLDRCGLLKGGEIGMMIDSIAESGEMSDTKSSSLLKDVKWFECFKKILKSINWNKLAETKDIEVIKDPSSSKDYFFESRRYRSRLAILWPTFWNSILKKVKPNKIAFIKLLIRTHKGAGEHGLIAKILWYLSMSKWPGLVQWIESNFWFLTDAECINWVKNLKPLEQLVRENSCFGTLCLPMSLTCEMMYLSCLTGWIEGTPDPVDEMKKRSSDGVICKARDNDGIWSKEAWNEKIDLAASALFQKFGIKQITFEEFVSSAGNWAAKGSAAAAGKLSESIVLGVERVFGKEKTVSLTKSTAVENDRFLKAIIAICKYIVGSAPTKVQPKKEVGKINRMIATGNLALYVAMRMITEFTNTRVGNSWTQFNNANGEDVRMWLNCLKKDVWQSCLMSDYIDFNSRHSLEEMRLLWRKVFEMAHITDERFCAMWRYIDGALNNIKITNDVICTKPAKHGMITGWMLTAWTNDLMNVLIAMILMEDGEMHDKIASHGSRVSGGDDSIEGPANFESIYNFYKNLIKSGQPINYSKQLFTGRSMVSELFRKMIFKEGKVHYLKGSLCRILGNFVSGNWDNADSQKVEERVVGLNSVINKMRSRGLSLNVAMMCSEMINSKVNKVANGYGMQLIDNSIIHGKKKFGGLGVPDLFGKTWDLDGQLIKKERMIKMNYVNKKIEKQASLINASKLVSFGQRIGLNIKKEYVGKLALKMAGSKQLGALARGGLLSENKNIEKEMNQYFLQKGKKRKIKCFKKEEENKDKEGEILFNEYLKWMNDRKKVNMQYNKEKKLSKIDMLRRESGCKDRINCSSGFIGAEDEKMLDWRNNKGGKVNQTMESIISSIESFIRSKVCNLRNSEETADKIFDVLSKRLKYFSISN